MVEKGESFLECAKREVREETLLDVQNIGPPVYKTDNSIYYLGHLDRYSQDITLVDDPEITGIGWINVDCLLRSDNLFRRLNLDTKSIVRRLVRSKL